MLTVFCKCSYHVVRQGLYPRLWENLIKYDLKFTKDKETGLYNKFNNFQCFSNDVKRDLAVMRLSEKKYDDAINLLKSALGNEEDKYMYHGRSNC